MLVWLVPIPYLYPLLLGGGVVVVVVVVDGVWVIVLCYLAYIPGSVQS